MKLFKNKYIYKFLCCFISASFLFHLNIVQASTLITPTTEKQENVSDFDWPSGPSVNADAAIVMEASTGLILYEKNIKEAFYPASITKILTTLLALENNKLDETVTMSHEAEWDVDFNSSRIGLVEGEQLSLQDALYAVMLESANEVSYAVAEHTANGTVEDFAKMMNERAKELGAVNSNFVNPHGLHNDNHYTCAYDMALIGRAAIQNSEFRKITGSRTYTIPATNKNVERPLANHHRFIKQTITYDGVIGGKTGGTNEAKTTLVTFAERNGLTLIAVVLHVDTAVHAYEDTGNILDFSFDNYQLYDIKQTELTSDSVFPNLFSTSTFFSHQNETLLRVGDNSNIVLPLTAKFEDAEKDINLEPVNEFVHGDNKIGEISYTYAGKYVGSADIIYFNPEYPTASTNSQITWPSYLISPDVYLASKTSKGLNSVDTLIPVINSSTQPLSQSQLSSTIPGIVNNTDNNTFSETKETNASASTDVNEKSFKLKPVFLGIVACAIILVVGWYILFVELPHRRRRKAYRANHRRRMDTLKYRDDLNL